MDKEELEKILAEHKLWLATAGKEGNKADLQRADLQEADLQGADLQWAYLQGTKLENMIVKEEQKKRNVKGANNENK